MNYAVKLREKVIEHRLRVETMVAKNQFGFMSSGFTIEAIYLPQGLMETY